MINGQLYPFRSGLRLVLLDTDVCSCFQSSFTGLDWNKSPVIGSRQLAPCAEAAINRKAYLDLYTFLHLYVIFGCFDP